MPGATVAAADLAPSICLFHLVWAPLGLDRFRAFLDSYRDRPTGVPHRLHILFNGFAHPDEVTPYRQLLDGIEHESTVLPAPVQDIQAYLEGARVVDAEFVCFLNSYSVILQADWLARLHHHASRASVGLVGATGTYESFLTAFLTMNASGPLRLGANPLGWPRKLLGWSKRGLRRRIFEPRYAKDHDPFPNPHLRTNAFMIRRALLLGLGFGAIRSKQDALIFENGNRSLTRRVRDAGGAVLIVGADGLGYPVEDWPASRTFRGGAQENLLIADNRTREFLAAPAELRRVLGRLAWGDQASDPIADADAVASSPTPRPVDAAPEVR